MPETTSRRRALVDELLRRFGAALRGAQLYTPGHPLVLRNIATFGEAVSRMLDDVPSVTIALVADEVVVGDMPAARGAATLGELFARLKARGIERLTVERGVAPDELTSAVEQLCQRLRGGEDPNDLPAIELPHVRVGQVRVEQRVQTSLADMATLRRLYSEASATVRVIWDTAIREGSVQAEQVRGVVDDLAQAVTQNRHALVALTTMRTLDAYTFTHLVNVSILTMAQARGLGIDGTLLREFGVAGLMHDIGKVHVPPEILQKTTRLDDRETAVIRRHPATGASILRRAKDVTPLAAIVAFEHHLRLNGSGYPEGVTRPSLNLATMLTTISDVYDAMRSKRGYQEAFPVDRILAVLNNDGQEFEPNLVKRFVHLMGLYPTGSFVRLNTGAGAVVLRPYPTDPHRPRVRVVYAPDGHRLDIPYDVDLWDVTPAPHRSSSVTGPAAPPEEGFDPLSVM
jgi:putative nucleotidyltransferase with HDIG domain